MKSRTLLLASVLLLPQAMFAQAVNQTNAQAAGASQAAGAATDDEMISLNKQVTRLFGERKYDEALPLSRRAVEAGERLYGKDDLRLAPVLINLAVLNLVKGRREEAELLFKRSITIYEQKAGQDDPRLTPALYHYGWLQFIKGDYGKAEATFKRSISILESTYGKDNVEVAPHLSALAEFYSMRRNYPKANSLYERAASILEKTEGVSKQLLLGTLERDLCLQINFAKTKEANLVLERLYKLKVPFDLKDGKPTTTTPKKETEGSLLAYERLAGDRDTLLYNFVGTLEGKLVSKPLPEYPAKAQTAQLRGMVVMRIVVNEEGKVISATPMCAHPLLAQAAQKAALNAKFTPTLQDGRPVKVFGYIFYHFDIDKNPVGPSIPTVR